jgi:cytoskeletal protein RodZ
MAMTIGEQLKQAREGRGWSLDQAAQATFIRRFYLEALEEDRRDALPSNVQGRGFLRLYASHLKMPVEPLLAIWDGKTPPETETAAVKQAPAPPAPILADEPANDDSPLAQSPERAPIEIPPPAAATEDISAKALFTQDQEAAQRAPADNEAPALPVGSQAIFHEIGVQLRVQRESLGLTMAEVEHYTRLRQHYIQALEDGRLDGLPSPVQGRGMLSNYAEFLNLDEEKILLRFAEALQIRRVERMPKPEPQPLIGGKKKPARQAPFWRRFLTPDLIFGVGIAGIILFFALWTASRINNLRRAEAVPTPPDISGILLTQAPGSRKTAESQTPEATGSSAEETSSGNTGENPENPAATVDSAVQPEAQTTATLPPINNDPLQVYIVARQRAWLRVITDGKVQYLGRVVPGNAYAFSGSKRIELSTGNAAGLQVFYNQNDLGTLGLMGDVVNLIFSAEGMMTPTAAFTPTLPPTKLPTITPLPSATPKATATITPFVP